MILKTKQAEEEYSMMSSSGAIVLSLFYGLAIFFGSIMNLLIIVAVFSVTELQRRKANRFLASLCFSDFLTCLFSVTYHLIHLHESIYGNFLSITYCRVTQYFVFALAFSSTLCLAMLCIDRYLAIIHPFFYIREAMNTISKVLMAWPWILSFTTSIPALVIDMIKVGPDFGFPCAAVANWNTTRYFIAVIPVNIVIPFVCIVITCLVVFRVARQQLHQIQTEICVLKSSAPNTLDQVPSDEAIPQDTLAQHSSSSLNPTVPKKKKERSNQKKIALRHRVRIVFKEETRIAFATIAVVIGFFIAWTPYLVSRFLFAIGQTLSNDVYMFGTVFVLSNSAWNPFLIFLFRKDIRKSVRKICKKTAGFVTNSQ